MGLDRQLKALLLLFALLMIAAAVTDLLGAAAAWFPVFGLEGLSKAVTAALSVVMAALIWLLVPNVLAAAGRALTAAESDLRAQSERRAAAVARLKTTRAELRELVAERTEELTNRTALFEAALGGSQITTWLQDADLRYQWIQNPRLGMSAKDFIGRTDDELFSEALNNSIVPAKLAVLAGAKQRVVELTIDDGPDQGAHFRITILPKLGKDGAIEGVLGVAVDLTERHMFELRLASILAENQRLNRRFNLALRDTTITPFEQDEHLVYTWASNAPKRIAGGGWLGRTDSEIFPSDAAARLNALKREALASGASLSAEFTTTLKPAEEDGETTADRRLVFSLHTETLAGAGGSGPRLSGVLIDITELRAREENTRLLMREVTHRSKNLLAVVQSMARQTARRIEDPAQFVELFSGRLQAMATSHDLLVHGAWRGVDLEALLAAQFAQFFGDEARRYSLSGPPVELTPDIGQSLGMAIHELITNAAKYGALSGEVGRVSVDWRIDAAEGDLQIAWRESDGPPVTPPAQTGFGTMLLKNLIESGMGGSLSFHYAITGFACEIVAPMAKIAVDVSTGSASPRR